MSNTLNSANRPSAPNQRDATLALPPREGRGEGKLSARPIRVCYLIDELAVAGTETKVLRVIDHLDRSKVEPYLCLLRGQSETSRALEPACCPVERLGVGSLHHLRTLGKLLRFAKILRKWRIDILQVQFPDSTYFGVLAGVLARVPRIVRTRFALYYWTTRLQHLVGRRIDGLYNLFFVDAMLADCQANAEAALASERYPPRAIAVIENGIDPAQFGLIDAGFTSVIVSRPLILAQLFLTALLALASRWFAPGPLSDCFLLTVAAIVVLYALYAAVGVLWLGLSVRRMGLLLQSPLVVLRYLCLTATTMLLWRRGAWDRTPRIHAVDQQSEGSSR